MPKVVELEERWGIYARTVVTSSTIDKILGRTEETSEKIAGTCVKIVENCEATDTPELTRKNLRKIDVIYAMIGATCVRTIEICDTIVRTDAMTAVTCGAIWAAEDTAAASRGLDTARNYQDVR